MSAKRIILIAEDYSGQHSNLAAELKKLGDSFAICKNNIPDLELNIMRRRPKLIVLNSSRLGYEAVCRLCKKLMVEGIQAEILNIYTYEDSEELTKLYSRGVTYSCTFPYSPSSLADQIELICRITPENFKEFKKMIGEKVNLFLDKLCPPSRQRGREYLYEAIMMVAMETHIRINFTSEIYTRIAHTYNTSVQSVEHSIRITINACWKSDRREILKNLFPNSILSDKKPSNIELVIALSQRIQEENRRYFDVFNKDIRHNSFNQLYI